MAKVCDNKSVGMLVWKNDELLLIERRKPPFGFAPPAGHVDNDALFEVAAKRELQEEVGLETERIELVAEGRKENKCRREGGSWHYWKIYHVQVSGSLKRSEEETKQAHFYNKNTLATLSERTEQYLRGEILEKDWETSPGLEPVWYEWLKELKIT